MSKQKRITILTASFIGAAVVLSGCSGSSEEPAAATVEATVSQATPASTPTTASSTPTVPAGSSVTVEDVKVSTDEIPTVGYTPNPEGATELLKKTIIEGPADGTAISSLGDTVNVNYVGYGLTTGIAFDGNFGQPGIEFQLGSLIPGWGEGLQGAKEGDRVLLIVPADKAYGATPPTDKILPNETLIFVLDINKVTPAS